MMKRPKASRLWTSLVAAPLVLLAGVPLGGHPGPGAAVVPEDATALARLDRHTSFMIAADLGRNGYYDQVPIAHMMGAVAEITGPELIAALGDVHHFRGVESVHDPLWQTNFEWVYSHPELMIPWYPVLGNHEYRGSTAAVLGYSAVSRRWEMPDRYYALTEEVDDGIDALLVFIDTTPLIDKYREDGGRYPDVPGQSMERQLAWIDATLGTSEARWKVVMGHHPVYAGTPKPEHERTDLQQRLRPILDAHGVDLYVSGHIHNFQHIRVPGSDVDWVVNSSASKARKVVPLEGALFASPEPGFALCSMDGSELVVTFLNREGRILYQHVRRKVPESGADPLPLAPAEPDQAQEVAADLGHQAGG